jgi:hypothetical protein
MKQQSKSFKQYLLKSTHKQCTAWRKKGITLGWLWKSHLAFSYHRANDGLRIVSQNDLVSASAVRWKEGHYERDQLRQTIAERWDNLTAITGGSLYGKSFIPFGKECGLHDNTMHHLI